MLGRLFSIYKAGKFLYDFYQGLKLDAKKREELENKEHLKSRKTNATSNQKPKRPNRSKRNS